MLEFHYECIKRKDDAKLLFTDTDTLVYEIKANNVYEEFLNAKVYLILVTIHRIQIF